MDYKIQDRLISILKTQIPKQPDLVRSLANTLGISRRTAYSRIANDTSFSIVELEKLMSAFQIDPHMLILLHERKGGLQNADASEIVRQLMESWVRAVNSLQNQPDAHIMMITNSLPLTLAFHFPSLIKFRVYHILKYILHLKRFSKTPLDMHSILFQDFENYCTKIRKIYSTIPTTEIWGPSAIKLTLRQLKALHQKSLLSTNDYIDILHDLIKLLNLTEEYAVNGDKSNERANGKSKKVPSFRLIRNDTLGVDEYTILSWSQKDEEHLFVYHPIFGETKDPTQKFQINQYSQLLVETGEQISSVNGPKRTLIFQELKHEILMTEQTLLIGNTQS